jgi:excisionase family DNA binding protein
MRSHALAGAPTLPPVAAVEALPHSALAPWLAHCAALAVAVAARLAGADADEWLTPDGAAKRLGVTRRWLYENAARLGGRRVGRYVRFSRRALDEAVRRGEAGL